MILKSLLKTSLSSFVRMGPLRFITKKKRYPEYMPELVGNTPRATSQFTMIPQEFPFFEDVKPLRLPEIRTRMLFVLSKYDKVALSDKFDWKGDFEKDHGLDSLDKIAIVTSIEEEFHTVFEDNVFDTFKSFQEVVDYLRSIPHAF